VGGKRRHRLQPGAVRWLIVVAVAVRVLAAVILVAGPWTDQPGDLAGWDVARFQDMADEPGRPWVDFAVEYPPGSVVLIETLAWGGVVATHRTLVLLSLAVDLSVALLVARLGGRRAAAGYLLLGLPLVPMGLLRFDLWASGLAVAAAVVAARRRPGWATDSTIAGLVTVAALIKVWPALLVAALWAARRTRAAVLSVVAMAGAGTAWLGYGGWSPDPVRQVLSLRGATGWHLESVPGSITALFGSAQPNLQLDAFRIGQLDNRVVLMGRVLTLVTVAALALLGRRSVQASDANQSSRVCPDQGAVGDTSVRAMALVTLGAVAALVVTAPLLSPQFLLWLTPWAALQLADRQRRAPAAGPARPPAAVGLTAIATTVTGLTLLTFGPSGVGGTLPSLLLLGRDLTLVGVVVAAGAALTATGSSGTEHPLGNGGAGPHPARA
jgi:hypothetical protein